jgi:ComF family protein
MSGLSSFVLDLLYPKRCVGCQKTGSYFCQSCSQNITQTDLVCPGCERLSLGGVVHPICKRRYGLDGLWSLGEYKDPLRRAIQKLKYKWIQELSVILVDITIVYWAKHSAYLLDEIKKKDGEDWMVVPVPLHWSRKNWRGFNQSALIAEDFAQKLGLHYADCLSRVRYTKPQVKLLSSDRHQNIKNAFEVNRFFAAAQNDKLVGENIILVDDVWTTGSTLKECCYVLKKGGAKKVWALTLAR